MNTKKNILASTIAFFMGSAVQGVVAQEDVGGQEESGWLLEEVVVTATKRGDVGLQNTPLSISVLGEAAIEKRGFVGMEDYLPTLPSVSYVDLGAIFNRVIIRGLALSAGGPTSQSTSSAYLGEMPMSAASTESFDIKLIDIERVEVLRGPQGTLYGSGALGGIVRSVPAAPSLDGFEGSIKVEVSSQDESDDLSHVLEGVANIPLSETLALRVAGYNHGNAGYIDYVNTFDAQAVADLTGSVVQLEEDANSISYSGARASVLWVPLDELKATLMLGTQELNSDGLPDSSLPGFKTSSLNLIRDEVAETDYSNLLVEYDFGWATLMSSTSSVEQGAESEFPYGIGRNPEPFFGPMGSRMKIDVEIFSQEIRLASQLDGPWQFLAGVFYEDVERERVDLVSWYGSDSALPPLLGGSRVAGHLLSALDYEQKAFFGELSYQFNDQWELTLGGRHYSYDRSDTSTALVDAPFSSSSSDTDVSTDESGNNYKVNLSFTPNEDTLIYAQWSEGFRLGKGQPLPPASLCDTDGDGKLDGTEAIITDTIESDTSENIELGGKFVLLDRRLTVNTAVFRIDWDNIPLGIRTQPPVNATCDFIIANNIGEARSQGVEFEANYSPNEKLLFNLAASYMDTELTETLPPFLEGDDLVLAPRTNASIGAQYNFDLTEYPAYVRADVNYVGEYETSNRSFPLTPGGDYVKVNLRTGVTIDEWSLSAYVTNLTNDDSLVNHISPTSEVLLAPRKIGIAVNYDF